MKVLLDECTPHVLKRLLTDFDITTVQELGWAGIKNGALLQLVEGHLDVLITSDQNLKISTEFSEQTISDNSIANQSNSSCH